jgi:uncharacterized SAM-binding protein YcdF (DUF218 family)
MMDFMRLAGAVIASPMCIVFAIGLLGLLLWRLRRPRAGLWLGCSALVLLYLFSIPPVADALLGPLERAYAPLDPSHLQAPRYVVVLGSGFAPRGQVPVTGALDAHGLARIVEGIRLLGLWPEARLVVSGGASLGQDAPARGYELLARELGVDASRLIVLDGARNTTMEAVAIAARVKGDAFVLVTSAFHMPRAMAEMRRRNLRPTPAPTAQLVDDSRGFRVGHLLPDASALQRSDFAMHEYLGLLAFRLGVGA